MVEKKRIAGDVGLRYTLASRMELRGDMSIQVVRVR